MISKTNFIKITIKINEKQKRLDLSKSHFLHVPLLISLITK